MVVSRKEVLTTCGVTQAIKQADYLIACITPQVVSTSFQLVTSNQRSTKSGDFVTSYGGQEGSPACGIAIGRRLEWYRCSLNCYHMILNDAHCLECMIILDTGKELIWIHVWFLVTFLHDLCLYYSHVNFFNTRTFCILIWQGFKTK